MANGSNMRFRGLLSSGIVIAGLAWMALGATEKQTAKVLPSLKPVAGVQMADISGLEERASFSPSAANIAELATAYLDQNQPGLATAAIERAPSEIRRQPAVAQLHARALFQRGRAREALAVAKDAHDACVSAAAGERRCPSWLAAKTAGQLAFFKEVVAAGIEDPYADPSGTKAAYERSAREIRLVAVR
jgi:hypothetical protein